MRHCPRAARYGRRVIGDGLVVSMSSILAGLYIGLLRGGRVRNLGLARIEWWGLLVVGVAVPVVVDHTEPSRAVTFVTVSLLALILFAVRNRALTGMTIVAIGLCANAGVMVLNDGMPVRRDALVAAGLATSDEVNRVEISGVQRLERDGDRLLFLADVIPLAETNQVLSFGDLIILAGLADVAANLLLARRRPSAASSSRPSPPPPARAPSTRAPVPRARNIPDFEPIVVDDPAPAPARVLVGAGAGFSSDGARGG
jgi:uncharacterized protein DUF5317